jgi:hypothetical protein
MCRSARAECVPSAVAASRPHSARRHQPRDPVATRAGERRRELYQVPPQEPVTRKCHPRCSYPELGRSQDSDRVTTRDEFARIVLQLALPRDVATKHIHRGMDAALAAPRRGATDHLPGRRRADGGAVGGNACAEPAASPGRLAAPPDRPRRQGDVARRGRAVAASPPDVAPSSYLRRGNAAPLVRVPSRPYVDRRPAGDAARWLPARWRTGASRRGAVVRRT